MTVKVENIFGNIPYDIPEEIIQVLFQNKKIKIERIISRGHASEEGFWYDQEQDEFVILLKGNAELKFFNEN